MKIRNFWAPGKKRGWTMSMSVKMESDWANAVDSGGQWELVAIPADLSEHQRALSTTTQQQTSPSTPLTTSSTTTTTTTTTTEAAVTPTTSTPTTTTNKSVSDRQKARAHNDRMGREGMCRVPRASVIHVKDVYPHSHKTYFPHCTILHKCGTDTGCCPDGQTCRAKATANLTLVFYTKTMGEPKKIERLKFYNETECACQRIALERKEERPVNDATAAPESPVTPKSMCMCPHKFTPRYFENGECICDCFYKQKDCLRLKRGKDSFSREDEMCIEGGMCSKPSCEFGAYLREYGRCVRKEEPAYSVHLSKT